MQILKKVNSCSFNGLSEVTKADSYCTTELRSRETSPTSHLFHSKLSTTECSSPSPVKEAARRKKKAPRALPPHEIMKRRWEYRVSERVPYCDQTDIFSLSGGPTRQFAPEYS